MFKLKQQAGKSTNRQKSDLMRLSRLYGLQTSYRDVSGKRREASPEALIYLLRSFGAPVSSAADASDAFREKKTAIWSLPIEPVIVAWQGREAAFSLRLPADQAGRLLSINLQLEDGEQRSLDLLPESSPLRESADVEGRTYSLFEISLLGPLPPGYHRLSLETPAGKYESMIVSAPAKAYAGSAESKSWGVFIPLYALHSKKSWGGGDFGDFEKLHEWVSGFGGQAPATLPFLAAFLDEPCEPSPYSPASRLFWNEFFLDLHAIADLDLCDEARKVISSIESKELDALQALPFVDYRKQMELKRRVIESLTECFFKGTVSNPSFRRFIESHSEAERYAQFRAAGERLGRAWPEWPRSLRDGVLKPDDYDEKAYRYHLYAQWLAHEQIQRLAEKTGRGGSGLYLDMPLGTHPYAYDVWSRRPLFLENTSGGAPPDLLFTKGQNWGFPPMHPERIRRDGYRYVTDFLRHIMKLAGTLRIDHVMGLHRIYCIPRELDASQGVYARYPSEELYAILSLESHRYKCMLVGENLGTVPDYVNEALRRHNIHQMYIAQYELEGRRPDLLRPVPANCVASLNTHDMPTLGGFWQGKDIEDRKEIGLLDEKAAQREHKARQTVKKNLGKFLKQKGHLKGPAGADSVARAALDYLGSSKARIVFVNLEDLWQEDLPQNLPGTSAERPNWRRKAKFSLEDIQNMPELADILREVNQARRRKAKVKPNG